MVSVSSNLRKGGSAPFIILRLYRSHEPDNSQLCCRSYQCSIRGWLGKHFFDEHLHHLLSFCIFRYAAPDWHNGRSMILAPYQRIIQSSRTLLCKLSQFYVVGELNVSEGQGHRFQPVELDTRRSRLLAMHRRCIIWCLINLAEFLETVTKAPDSLITRLKL